ncbi:18641_t:CDS:2, partial [Rhizophagus irregularis]
DILHEEPDFSSIKSNETITGYGPCGERDLPFLTEDPPRSLILNLPPQDFNDDGYYISPTSNEASKKRKRQGGSRKSTTQTIIRELSIRPPSGISIDAPSEDSDMREVSNQFHKFYYDIDNAE